jgi:UDP-N-acetylglucosamine 2-epimerase (non-hydrolysing)
VKVLGVLGTRPEAIKLAPVIRELRARAGAGGPAEGVGAGLQTVVCVTGQHRELLDPMLSIFGIEPDYDLELMENNQSPTRLASAALARLEPILETERPDWVLVQGDTTTVAAASLAAFYARVRVGHVEAGLRTGDKWQPFPEEINRRIGGVIADLHFAPTSRARDNLLREGVSERRIHVTGNTVIDALHWVAGLTPPETTGALLRRCRGESADDRIVLVTAHRRENFGRPLESICLALRDLAGRPGVRVVYPVHLNPNVWGPVHQLLGGVSGVSLVPPLDYLSMVHLLKQSYMVLTDSGGLQEEAPGLGVPVLVLRETTERPEGVDAGAVRVIGTRRERIVAEACRLLDDAAAYRRLARAVNPYGDGHAGERIVSALLGSKDIAPGPAAHVGLADARH